jgi:hypothetical protein
MRDNSADKPEQVVKFAPKGSAELWHSALLTDWPRTR